MNPNQHPKKEIEFQSKIELVIIKRIKTTYKQTNNENIPPHLLENFQLFSHFYYLNQSEPSSEHATNCPNDGSVSLYKQPCSTTGSQNATSEHYIMISRLYSNNGMYIFILHKFNYIAT